MTNDNDPLVHHLIELCQELDKDNVSIVLGGGMSLYLRLKFASARTPRYPFDAPVRSTADLDVFLSSRLIADREKIESLKASLTRLGYEVDPKAKNFQFIKPVKLFGQDRVIKIDLLAAPPDSADKAKVEIKKPRIKPSGVEGIHAYLTDEAAGIEIGKQPFDMARLDSNLKLKNQVLFIPSSFNYLILKLHAFEDRKNREDAKSNFGRHHAFDLFATVARMSEEDWKIAQGHLGAHRGEAYLANAIAIRKENFSSKTSLGSLRLRESQSYQSERTTYDAYLDAFLKDLTDLFPA
jgi:hypothetical protein